MTQYARSAGKQILIGAVFIILLLVDLKRFAVRLVGGLVEAGTLIYQRLRKQF